MHIDYVIHSSDDSHYLEFWPYTARTVDRLGFKPVLVHVTNSSAEPSEDENGLIIKVQKSSDFPPSFQAQVARMWGAQFLNGTVMISDIDMFLFNRDYFNFPTVPEGAILNLSCDAYPSDHHRLPICYTIAAASVFTEALQLVPNFESFLALVASEASSDWDADERFLSQRLLRNKRFLGFNRNWPHGIAELRIDRVDWHWSMDLIYSYIDCHSLRPIKDNLDEIERLFAALSIPSPGVGKGC